MLKAAPMVQIKAGPDDGMVEGQFEAYASVFDNKDSYGDVVRKGAFADTLKEWSDSGNSIPLLFGHNMDDPDYNIGHILEAKEDERGLRVKAQLDLDCPKGMQVYRLLKGRRINQMSFAYDVLEGAQVSASESKAAGKADLGDYYELRKMKLYEVSVVTIGANSETEILAVKHAADVIKKAGRTISTENEQALREAIDKIKSVLPDSAKSGNDHSEASGTAPSQDQKPAVTNPSVDEPEAKSNPSVDDASYFAFVAML